MLSKHKKRKREIIKLQRDQAQSRKSTRRQIRHNTAANQEKHRADWQPLQPDEFGKIASQRIMPRDENERRANLEELSSRDIGENVSESDWLAKARAADQTLGIVTEVSQGICRTLTLDCTLLCEFRGALTAEGSGYSNLAAVGDRVLVSTSGSQHGVIEAVLPRRSALVRPDSHYRHLKRVIAANVDQLLIVASWREPQIWLEMIDEYLIGSVRSNISALICLNKVDLANDVDECRALLAPYGRLGHQVIYTSALTGTGLDRLNEVLSGKTTVLSGLSGVGKSSLLAAVEEGLDLRVGTVNRLRQQGRHTTSQANMFALRGGGQVIDTPGIRDFGIDGLDRTELITFYPEIEALHQQCKFNDCSHDHEPGCAIKTAVVTGQIAQWRYENYINLYNKL